MYINKDSVSNTLFRTIPYEKNKLIFQLGSNNSNNFLKAFNIISKDINHINLNMGCPKSFSINKNMGAALLNKKNHYISYNIIKTFKRNYNKNKKISIKIPSLFSSILCCVSAGLL